MAVEDAGGRSRTCLRGNTPGSFMPGSRASGWIARASHRVLGHRAFDPELRRDHRNLYKSIATREGVGRTEGEYATVGETGSGKPGLSRVLRARSGCDGPGPRTPIQAGGRPSLHQRPDRWQHPTTRNHDPEVFSCREGGVHRWRAVVPDYPGCDAHPFKAVICQSTGSIVILFKPRPPRRGE